MPVVNRAVVGYRKRGGGAKVQHAEIERICEMRLAGESLSAIGQQYGITHTTVRRLTAHLKPPLGHWPRGRLRPRPKQAFAERLLRSGFTLAEVSEETGMSVAVVSDIRRKRQHKYHCQTPMTRIMVAIRTVLGIKAMQIRKHRNRPTCREQAVNKARMIAFWIANKRAGLTYSQIGAATGGFDSKFVGSRVRLVQEIASKMDLPREWPHGRVARVLNECAFAEAA